MRIKKEGLYGKMRLRYKYSMKAAILGVLFLFLAIGCATAPKQARHSSPEEGISQDHFSEIEAKPVPLVMNDRVQDWINYFQGPSHERFERYLMRSGKYIPMIKRILRQYGLPEDLVYLAMIESGFNPHAYSRARATGTWQFIYRTGVRYGLRADNWIDERRDPEKSTIAAAKYLKDLYDQFNDWYLAAAGYNAGEGKIHRAIRKYRTEDFWEMSRQRYLRRETKDYVPKMIAAALISKNPGRYGFSHVKYEEPIPFEEVPIETPIDLRVAAQCAGVTYEEMVLEGYGPGGVAILVEALTDNRNRSAAELRNVFSKHGGNLAGAGSVSWLFQKKGLILVKASLIDEDRLMAIGLEAGAEDIRQEGDTFTVTTTPAEFEGVKQALAAQGIVWESADVSMVPSSSVRVEDRATGKQLLTLLDALEDHDDAQHVYANFDLPDAILTEHSAA